MRIWISHPTTECGQVLARLFAARGDEVLVPDLPSIATEDEIRAALDKYAAPDLLVLCPRDIRRQSIEDAPDEDVSASVYGNLSNAFQLNRIVGGAMTKKGGTILYVGSIHAEKPSGAALGFSMGMGALKMLCSESALQLGRSGITCIHFEVGPVASEAKLFDSELSAIYDTAEGTLSHGGLLSWEEAGKAIVDIAAHSSRVLNGASIRMDDAFTLHYVDRPGGDPAWT